MREGHNDTCRSPPSGAEGDNRMSTSLLADGVAERAEDSHWAVETHGLTKRFGENIAVNDVELLVPRGCAFGYLGPERCRARPR